ncbi:hypothetical protein L1887_57828 [Cichorium endivia]|nr:hypothetical protein L1887_57828 [Cichorium endivia]
MARRTRPEAPCDELVETPVADVLWVVVMALLLPLQPRCGLGAFGGGSWGSMLRLSAVDGGDGLLTLGGVVAGACVVGRAVVFGTGGTGGDDVGACFAVGQGDVGLGCGGTTVLGVGGLQGRALEGRDGLDDGALCRHDGRGSIARLSRWLLRRRRLGKERDLEEENEKVKGGFEAGAERRARRAARKGEERQTQSRRTALGWPLLCQSDGLGDEGGSPGQQRESDQPTQANAGLISAAPCPEAKRLTRGGQPASALVGERRFGGAELTPPSSSEPRREAKQRHSRGTAEAKVRQNNTNGSGDPSDDDQPTQPGEEQPRRRRSIKTKHRHSRAQHSHRGGAELKAKRSTGGCGCMASFVSAPCQPLGLQARSSPALHYCRPSPSCRHCDPDEVGWVQPHNLQRHAASSQQPAASSGRVEHEAWAGDASASAMPLLPAILGSWSSLPLAAACCARLACAADRRQILQRRVEKAATGFAKLTGVGLASPRLASPRLASPRLACPAHCTLRKERINKLCSSQRLSNSESGGQTEPGMARSIPFHRVHRILTPFRSKSILGSWHLAADILRLVRDDRTTHGAKPNQRHLEVALAKAFFRRTFCPGANTFIEPFAKLHHSDTDVPTSACRSQRNDMLCGMPASTRGLGRSRPATRSPRLNRLLFYPIIASRSPICAWECWLRRWARDAFGFAAERWLAPPSSRAPSVVTMSATADDVKARLSQLRADKALLQAQLESLRRIPDAPPEPRDTLDAENDELGHQLRALEERAILYRSAAWTCFEIDLDVGRRARLARRNESATAAADKDADLALGIRLDTLLARPLLRALLPRLGPPEPDARIAPPAPGHHGCGCRAVVARRPPPHQAYGAAFRAAAQARRKVPPQRARRRAVRWRTQCRQRQRGGRPDHACAVQRLARSARVPVRLALPSAGVHASALEALGTEAFDMVKITWDVPSASAEAAEDDEDEVAANPTAVAVQAVAKRKREMPQDEPMHQLEVVVRYVDLQSDRLVDDTRPTGLFSMTGSVDEEQDDFEGLRRPYGQVRVHMLEYAPELDTRQRRTPGISRADLGALRPETVRRQDLELLYAQAHDGEALDMDDAFQRVAQRVWSQRAKSSVEWQRNVWTWGSRRRRRLLKPEIGKQMQIGTQDQERDAESAWL